MVVFTASKIPSYSGRVKGFSPSRPGSCRVVAGALLRLYAPLQPLLDKTYKLNNIEKVK